MPSIRAELSSGCSVDPPHSPFGSGNTEILHGGRRKRLLVAVDISQVAVGISKHRREMIFRRRRSSSRLKNWLVERSHRSHHVVWALRALCATHRVVLEELPAERLPTDLHPLQVNVANVAKCLHLGVAETCAFDHLNGAEKSGTSDDARRELAQCCRFPVRHVDEKDSTALARLAEISLPLAKTLQESVRRDVVQLPAEGGEQVQLGVLELCACVLDVREIDCQLGQGRHLDLEKLGGDEDADDADDAEVTPPLRHLARVSVEVVDSKMRRLRLQAELVADLCNQVDGVLALLRCDI
mmetsp:Transcript_54641/g.125837  ORF Transcript_54641/g.125837 Transcript_54641/m.125837 type:complete len:298 (-) Transcript_54641:165-1058(-)